MKVQLLASAIAVLGFGVATAQDRPPDWVKRPTTRDIQSVWPQRALKEGYGGNATISCIVSVQGTLRACQVVEETPKDGGFGSAALALSPQFLMKPALKNGVPVEATARIPIAFPTPDKKTGSRLIPVTDTDFRGERVFTDLPWRQAPTYAEVLAAYPEKARVANIGGTTTLDCRIDKDGGLSACRTMREAPEGFGFASSARTLIEKFSTPTTDGKGESIAGSRVHLRIGFAAESLSAATPAIGKPEWQAFPSMADFTAVIPAAARAAKVFKARVVMLCGVGADGALSDCKVQSEDPAALGYGDAALRLAPYFRLAVWTEEGLPAVGGVVRMPLRFDLEAAMAAKQP